MTVYLALRVRDRVSLVGILNLYNVTKSIADAASGGVTVPHHEKPTTIDLHYVTRKRFLKIALVSKREHLPRKRELKYVKFNKSTKNKNRNTK